MTDWTKENVEETYHVESWGNGYFTVNERGNLAVRPQREQSNSQIDISDVIEEMKVQNIPFPAVVRFHDVLRSQVVSLNQLFRKKIDEANYLGQYMGVYPIKVNQMREVVEEIVDAGAAFDHGLEAGSKSELLAVLALNQNEKSLTILNGYKDRDYLKLALIGTKLGRKMMIVIEKLTELNLLVQVSKEMGIRPLIGFRCKMMSKGPGRWSASSGEKSKFGLSTAEIIKGIQILEENNLSKSLRLIHFHIGSQITDIRAIKDGISEGARIYAKLKKMGLPLEYLDVGGGLSIDYDGSNSTRDSSRNYSPAEYVSDVVYGIQQVCQLERVDEPVIITESGRAITAHHSCIVTNVIGEIKPAITDFPVDKKEGEHVIVSNLREILEDATAKNIQETFNDATEQKEMSLSAFKLGVITLEERAKIETLYAKILHKIYDSINDLPSEEVPEGLGEVREKIASQYLCNLSVFQSAADSWAIDQVLPIVPITRLNEKPTKHVTLVDITCDSDGKIDNFIGAWENEKTLPVHELKDEEDYYLGIFLTGAYQDVMGDNHNLFGRLNEVHVFADHFDPSGFFIEEYIRGTTAGNVLSTMQYNPVHMAYVVKAMIDRLIKTGDIHAKEGVKMIDFYEDLLQGYTYLS